MLVTLSGIVTDVRLSQRLNAEFPMLVTLLGIVTDVRLVQELNAKFPMLVTLWGMVTAEAEPRYFVMVTELLEISYLNRPFSSFSSFLHFCRTR